MLMDIIVLQLMGVLSKIRENNRENKVLEDEITVEADIEVSNKLQLKRTPLMIVFRRIKGAVEI